MKLVWEYEGDTFSLIEDEKAECGYSVVCTSETPSESHEGSLSRFQEVIPFLAMERSGPSMPDAVDNIHGFLSDDEDVRILEYEGIEYPENAVF